MTPIMNPIKIEITKISVNLSTAFLIPTTSPSSICPQVLLYILCSLLIGYDPDSIV